MQLSKVIKNEFREASRNYLFVMAGGLAISTIVWIFLFTAQYTTLPESHPLFKIFVFLSAIFPFLICTTIIVYFTSVVSNFKSDFFTDKAYLKFTRPVTAYHYLGGKVIVTCLWTALIGLVILGLNYIVLKIYTTVYDASPISQSFAKIQSIANSIGLNAFHVILLLVFSFIGNLLAFYLSVVLTKCWIKDPRYSNLWFFIYFSLTILLSWIHDFIGLKLLNFSTFSFDSLDFLTAKYLLPYCGIGLIGMVILYLLAAYLIEHHIDF